MRVVRFELNPDESSTGNRLGIPPRPDRIGPSIPVGHALRRHAPLPGNAGDAVRFGADPRPPPTPALAPVLPPVMVPPAGFERLNQTPAIYDDGEADDELLLRDSVL